MIESMLKRYTLSDAETYYQALCEVMQEIALAGLYRADFFGKAAFYGGSSLRVFHGLDRFSETLSFALLDSDSDFSLNPYFDSISKEFQALGISVDISAKKRRGQSTIQSASLKSNTVAHELNIQGMYEQSWVAQRPIKLSFEVDTQAPSGFVTSEKLLLQPFSFYVKCFEISHLHACELHTLLYRSWKRSVKGRYWYDLEWYVRNRHPVQLDYFLACIQNSGHLKAFETIDLAATKALLHDRIEQVDFRQAKADVLPLIDDADKLELWSSQYFHDLVEQLIAVDV